MTCCQCQGAASVFSQRYVSSELKRYRRRGPRSTTRMLIEALEAEGIQGATLLDIGGGVGALQYELLRAGASRATAAEAVATYVEAASREAARQGLADRVEQRHGDFVEMAAELEAADIVALDRVICCYPDVESLVGLSVQRARRLYGAVYPRFTWWTRLGHRCLNFLLWLVRNPFRVYTHPTHAVDATVRSGGFELRFRRETALWQVVVYGRDGSGG